MLDFRGLAASATALLLLASAPRPADAADKETIVFMRHGEKPPEGLGQLNCQGLNRAIALPWVLMSRYGKADALFAPDPGKMVDDHGQLYDYVRPLATIEPTAVALGRPVNTRFGFKDIVGLDAELLQDRYRNAILFVAWEHGMLVKAVRQLVARAGGDSAIVPDWSDQDFDSLYILTFTRESGRLSVAFSHQQEGLNGRGTSCP
jgi:hypothetical protein